MASERLLTAARMRAIEAEAIAGGALTGLMLMERAGQGVVAAILDTWPALQAAPHKAVILCGPGNNGGDGFVIARLLLEWGWQVEVFAFGVPDRLPPDAATNRARWAAMGPVAALPMAAPPSLRGGRGVIVDALFGTGLARGLGADLARAALLPFEAAEFRDWHRVAVDIPSGLCADSGRVLRDATGGSAVFRADLTVTFHSRKPGHVLAAGPDVCGRVVVCDIGLRGAPPADSPRLVDAPAPGDVAKPDGHKYRHGHALVLGGGQGATGASRLAARAALRVGAGLVTLGVPAESIDECAAQLTAIMLREVDDGAALARLLTDARLNALCVGPGLGLARARALVPAVLAARRPTVLDADALSAFSDDPAALFQHVHPDVVLTPHAGEFARLFPDLAARLAAPATRGPAMSRIDAAHAAAARAGCTLLLKGRDTIIATAEGDCAVHAAIGARAVPWLATAGAGDVLAGLIAGLLARGLGTRAAAEAASWLHVAAARRFGPGLIAEDLPETLPQVFRDLGL